MLLFFYCRDSSYIGSENTDPKHVDRAIWLFPLFVPYQPVCGTYRCGADQICKISIAPTPWSLTYRLPQAMTYWRCGLHWGVSASTSMVISYYR